VRSLPRPEGCWIVATSPMTTTTGCARPVSTTSATDSAGRSAPDRPTAHREMSAFEARAGLAADERRCCPGGVTHLRTMLMRLAGRCLPGIVDSDPSAGPAGDSDGATSRWGAGGPGSSPGRRSRRGGWRWG